MKTLANIYNALPVQLLVWQLKRNLFLLVIWLFLFNIVLGKLASGYGIPYLMLDPEYLGAVNFASFFLLGLAFGFFVLTYNVVSFIILTPEIYFLGRLKRPFEKFCINNAVIPVVFLLVFLVQTILMQIREEYSGVLEIVLMLTGFLGGFVLFTALSFVFFFNVNADIGIFLGINLKWPFSKLKIARKIIELQEKDISMVRYYNLHPTISYYFNYNLRLRRPLPQAKGINNAVVKRIFRHNIRNAFTIEIAAILVMIIFGILSSHRLFQIPAGAGIFILLALTNMTLGALSHWFKRWILAGSVLLYFLFNFIAVSFNMFSSSRVSNLNYAIAPKAYTQENLQQLVSASKLENSYKKGIEALENWKLKVMDSDSTKPVMIFLNVSGGGLRSAKFTLEVLQRLDSLTNYAFTKHTKLITGASGGMIGAAFYRELYLQSLYKKANPMDRKYNTALTNDLLNPVMVKLVTHDIFPRFGLVQLLTNYRVDRGTEFDKTLNINTLGMLNKKFSAYELPEKNGLIPQLMQSPVCLNDGRKCIISNLPVSNLCYMNLFDSSYLSTIDAFDFFDLLQDYNATDLDFVNSLRLSASFPYITPFMVLPTSPATALIDAGARDNYGAELSMRYLSVYKDWILANTSQVIVVQIRDSENDILINTSIFNSLAERLMSPIGAVVNNWRSLQSYKLTEIKYYNHNTFKNHIQFIEIPLIANKQNEEVSLSWHLTSKEKKIISHGVYQPQNQDAMKVLAKWLQ